MTTTSKTILERIHKLRVYKKGERRAPHKPLLLLFAIGELLRGRRRVAFKDVDKSLKPLLMAYAPPVKAKHQPELPYWYLTYDELWKIDGAKQLEKQKGGFPKMAGLRKTTAGLPDHIADEFEKNPELVKAVVRLLLEEHFTPSIYEPILAEVGISFDALNSPDDEPDEFKPVRRRDPLFREMVLRAYEYQCAFSGFRASLSGTYFGCEAAHVQWHSYEGPDAISNGIALEPTIHKLFDAGAWSLTDDRLIIVSAEFTGNKETVERIRNYHGKPLHEPLDGDLLDVDFIRWHRDPDLGGVFKWPPLKL